LRQKDNVPLITLKRRRDTTAKFPILSDFRLEHFC